MGERRQGLVRYGLIVSRVGLEVDLGGKAAEVGLPGEVLAGLDDCPIDGGGPGQGGELPLVGNVLAENCVGRLQADGQGVIAGQPLNPEDAVLFGECALGVDGLVLGDATQGRGLGNGSVLHELIVAVDRAFLGGLPPL